MKALTCFTCKRKLRFKIKFPVSFYKMQKPRIIRDLPGHILTSALALVIYPYLLKKKQK